MTKFDEIDTRGREGRDSRFDVADDRGGEGRDGRGRGRDSYVPLPDRPVTIGDTTLTLSQWAAEEGLNYAMVKMRYRRGARGRALIAPSKVSFADKPRKPRTIYSGEARRKRYDREMRLKLVSYVLGTRDIGKLQEMGELIGKRIAACLLEQTSEMNGDTWE